MRRVARMDWLRRNYGWQAKRREYIWLAVVLGLLVAVALGVEVVGWVQDLFDG